MSYGVQRLEALIAQDPGQRGVAQLQVPGDLSRAAGALSVVSRVLILTGFPVGPNGVAETDGPPGALFLGRALRQMGKEVTFATHRSCAPVMAAGIQALRLSAALEVLALHEPPHPILERHRPDIVVAIELPGKAHDREYYNMRGLPISDRVSQLDELLSLAEQQGVPTIGIGDGGNEAGMGKVMERIGGAVPHGAKIASAIIATFLVVAGISNWGAYGLIAALDRALLHSPAEELALLQALVEAGALDARKMKAEATVDGVEQERYLQVLIDLKREQ